jgi:sulfatase maturation enzyme AslB (radical SAM superfamily)
MNDYFCPNPFVYLTNSLEGTVKYCCLVHRGIKDDAGVTFDSDKANAYDIWNSNDLNGVRQQMINGTPVKDCEQCYKLEKMGGGSLRTDLLAYWMHGKGQAKFEKAIAEYNSGQSMSGPVSVEVRSGSICNLKCRMCYPTASILIEKEFNKLHKTEPQWTKISMDKGSSQIDHAKYFDEIVNNFDHIDILRFSGGEPFLNDTTNEVIAKAAATGHSKHIDLFVNTNFTKITTELLEDLSKFKTVTIDISLDGYKQVHEYIRSGLEWNTIEENLVKIRPYLNENFTITTNTTVQNLNVLYLEDILKWTLTELNITPVFCVLDNPKWLAVRNMPPAMKEEAKSRLKALINSEMVNNFKYPHWLVGRITSVIESIDLPADEAEYNRFLYFTKVTDQERNQDYRISIPEVAHYYEQYYPITEI